MLNVYQYIFLKSSLNLPNHVNMVNHFIINCNTIVYLVFTIWWLNMQKVVFLIFKDNLLAKSTHINVSVPGLYY